jgi:hypothetical protein
MVDWNGEPSAATKDKLATFGSVVAAGGIALLGVAIYGSATSTSFNEVYQKQYTNGDECLAGTDFDILHASLITRYVDRNEVLTVLPDAIQENNPKMLNFVVTYDSSLAGMKHTAALRPSDQATEDYVTKKCNQGK